MAHARKERVLHAADNLLCLSLFFPSMVFYWRGIWDLWGYYVGGSPPASSAVLFGIGNTMVLGYVCLPLLDRLLDRKRKWLYALVTRPYLYVFAALHMCLWRGGWELGDHYIGKDGGWNLVALAVVLGLMLLGRGSRNLLFSPINGFQDTRPDLLKGTTRFGVMPSLSVKYVLDCLLTHAIATLAIFAWQNAWNVVLSFMFEDHFLTNVTCLGVGYLGVGLLFLLEEPLARLVLWAEAKGWYAKLVVEDILQLVCFAALLFLWIGGWHLTAEFVFPSIPTGAWICHGIGTLLLLVTQQFSCVSNLGMSLDGSLPGRAGFFSTRVLRYYLLPAEELKVPEEVDKDDYAKVKVELESTNNNEKTVSDAHCVTATGDAIVTEKLLQNGHMAHSSQTGTGEEV